MPRKLIKRYMPDHETIRNHQHLRCFGKLIHDPNLWHLNRHSFARAVAIGLFCAFLPIPFQMLVAAMGAIICRANLPISVVLVWISNPITIPPIFYFTYKVGASIMGIEPEHIEISLSVEWVVHELGVIWEPLLLGSLLIGVVVSLLGYILVRIYWRWHVIHHYCKRHHGKNHVSHRQD